MEKIDYSSLYNIPLNETGFLSSESVEVLDFLEDNNIKTVGELIDSLKNQSYQFLTYKDTMIEIYGLVDMICCKYLNMPLVGGVYLEVPLRYSYFSIMGEKYVTLGIKTRDNKINRVVRTTIYTVINRLGFSDRERSMLLNKEEAFLLDKTLIDIFKIEYGRLKVKETLTMEENVFVNKLLFYINYCESRKENKSDSEDFDIDYVSSLIGEYSKLVSIKDGIDSLIEMVSKGKKGVNR